MKKAASLLLFFTFIIPAGALAQELVPDKTETAKAEVLAVLNQEMRNVPGTDVMSNYQTIRAQILEGSEKDKIVTVANDYLSLKQGEVFYLIHTINSLDGRDTYSVSEPYRLPAVLFFIILFIVLVFLFGGIQGMRGLLSLGGSLILILHVLIPGVLHGYSPILVSFGVASLIIILGSFVTHGFNKTTASAVIGMIATILVTGALAYLAVQWSRLSGFSDESAVYLNLNTRGSIDFVGLLLGGMLIGLLGVLYDVAIGQAISVEELHNIAPHIPRVTIYKRAIRIGREHIGALVNTLAIAYVGVSLPLLLLYSQASTESLSIALNRELFATEIIRTMIGSIGLVIAVPVTTLICVFLLMRKAGPVSAEKIEKEEQALEHFEHHH